jgi:hypothetical protein
MAVDVIIDPSSGQIYWNDQAGAGTQTIAISGNATNAINVVGYSNFFSAGGGGLGTQILATFTDSPTSTFTPGTNAYDLGSSSLRWNFYGTGGNFTGAISTSSTTDSTSSTTGALIVSGGAGIAKTSYFGQSVVIQGSTASTGFSTGALVVTGGVGIGGSLYTVTTSRSSISGVNFNNSRAENGFTINASSSYTFNIQDGANNQRLNYHADSNRTEFTGNNATHEIRLIHSNNSGYTGFKANSSGTVTYTLPAGDGSNGQVLYTNGSAGLAWTTPGAAGGGSSGVQAGAQYEVAFYTATGSSVSGSSTFKNDTAAAKVTITHTTAATSTTTGALVISGGVGIAGSIWSGQHIVTDTTVSSSTSTGAMLVFGGLGVSGQINAASLQTSGNAIISGNLQFNGVGTFGNATSDTINSLARYISDLLPSTDNSYDLGNNSLGWRNFRVSGVGTIASLAVTSTTASTSSTTGALTVSGGAGIAKTSYFGESVVIQGSTASTNPTNGALVVTGGVGIGGSLNVGNSSVADVIIYNTDYTSSANLNLRTGTGASLKEAVIGFNSTELKIQNTFRTITNYADVFQFYATNLDDYQLIISSAGATFYNTTASTSSTTGALRLQGGAGIAKTSYFGQSVVIQGTTASGSTTTGALTVTGGVGIGGSLNVFGTIDVANNIEVLSQKEVRFFNSANTFYTGLRAGSSSANVTFTLPVADGSANQVLYTNGSAGLAWTTVAGGGVSGIISLNGLTASTQTFATGTSGTDFNISSSTSTHTFNIPYAGSGATGLITTQAQTLAGSKTFSSQTIISDTTVSSSTATGALLVYGGLGVTGQINAASLQTAGNAVISGNLTFNGVGVFGNATSDTINSLARYISDILPSTDNSYDLGNNSLGWRNFRVSGVGTIASLQVTSVTAGVWGGTAISAVNGGTGQVSYTVGDLLYASSTTALSKLAAGTAGSVLKSNGAGTAPSWQVDSTGGGGGTVASGTANQVAIYAATGASVSGAANLTYNTTSVTITNTTASNNNSSGALLVHGGIGASGQISGAGASFTSTVFLNGIRIGQGGNNITFTDSAGTTIGDFNTSNGWFRSAQTTNSTSLTTGALVVSGGAGIAKTMFVGDNINIFKSGSVGALRLWNSANTFYTAFQAGAPAANTTYTLPIAFPGTAGSTLISDTSGVMSWAAPGGTGTVTTLTAGNGITFSTGTTITTTGTIRRRTSYNLVFMSGYTPNASGVDTVVLRVPDSAADAASVVYNCREVIMRVETAVAGTSTINIQKYGIATGTGTSLYSTTSTGSTTNILSAALSITGATTYEASSTTFAAGHGTCATGDKLRVNFTALNASHTSFTISLLIEEQ